MKTGWLYPGKNHCQVSSFPTLDDDPLVSILDFIQLVILAGSKRIVNKVSNRGQHGADEIGIGRFLISLMGHQETRFLLNQEYLPDLERQCVPNR